MQIISYNFIILEHIYSDHFTILKDIDAESLINFFLGGQSVFVFLYC